MSSVTHAIYRIDTGQIVSHYVGSLRSLAQNIPEGHASIEGRYDPLSQKVDVARIEADRAAALAKHNEEVEAARATFKPSEDATTVTVLAEPVFDFTPGPNHVVDWQPPQPNDDHEWHVPTKRWILKEAVVRAQHEHMMAQEKIDRAEAMSLRALREGLLSILPEGEIKSRIKAMDDQIAAQRPKIRK